MENKKKVLSRKQRVFKHLGRVVTVATSIVFLTSPVEASDFGKAGEVLGHESKELKLSLKIRSL